MIRSNLRKILIPLSDPAVAEWQTNYMRNQFPFLGVKVPLLRAAVKNLPSADWRIETMLLFEEPEREFHHAAILWAIKHRKEAIPSDLPLYEKLILDRLMRYNC